MRENDENITLGKEVVDMAIKQMSCSVKYKADIRVRCLKCKQATTNITSLELINETQELYLYYTCDCEYKGEVCLKMESYFYGHIC